MVYYVSISSNHDASHSKFEIRINQGFGNRYSAPPLRIWRAPLDIRSKGQQMMQGTSSSNQHLRRHRVTVRLVSPPQPLSLLAPTTLPFPNVPPSPIPRSA